MYTGACIMYICTYMILAHGPQTSSINECISIYALVKRCIALYTIAVIVMQPMQLRPWLPGLGEIVACLLRNGAVRYGLSPEARGLRMRKTQACGLRWKWGLQGRCE